MLSIKNLLLYVLLLPLFGVVLLIFIPSSDRISLRLFSFRIACMTFLLSLLLWVNFQKNTGMFQFVTSSAWISFLNLNFSLGIDGISLFFILHVLFL